MAWTAAPLSGTCCMPQTSSSVLSTEPTHGSSIKSPASYGCAQHPSVIDPGKGLEPINTTPITTLSQKSNTFHSFSSNEFGTGKYTHVLKKWKSHRQKSHTEENTASPVSGSPKSNVPPGLDASQAREPSYAALIGDVILRSRTGSLTEKKIRQSIMLNYNGSDIQELTECEDAISKALESSPYFELVTIRRLPRTKKIKKWKINYSRLFEELADKTDPDSRANRQRLTELPSSTELVELPDTALEPPVELPGNLDLPPSYLSISPPSQRWSLRTDSLDKGLPYSDKSEEAASVAERQDQSGLMETFSPVLLSTDLETPRLTSNLFSSSESLVPSGQIDTRRKSRPELPRLITNFEQDFLLNKSTRNKPLYEQICTDGEQTSEQKSGQKNSSTPSRGRGSPESGTPQRPSQRGEDDDPSQEDDQDGNSRKRRRFQSPGRSQPRRRFACIYHKHDSDTYGLNDRRYLVCAGTGFQYISELIRHLNRTHDEFICGKCLRIFDDEASKEDHSHGCAIRLKCSQEELWAGLWHAHFPGVPLPGDMYLYATVKRSSLSVNTNFDRSNLQVPNDMGLSSTSCSPSSGFLTSSPNTLPSLSPPTPICPAAAGACFSPIIADLNSMSTKPSATNDVQKLNARMESLEKRLPLVEQATTLLLKLMSSQNEPENNTGKPDSSTNPQTSHMSLPSRTPAPVHYGKHNNGVSPIKKLHRKAPDIQPMNIPSYPIAPCSGASNSVTMLPPMDGLGEELPNTSPRWLNEFFRDSSLQDSTTSSTAWMDLATAISEVEQGVLYPDPAP